MEHVRRAGVLAPGGIGRGTLHEAQHGLLCQQSVVVLVEAALAVVLQQVDSAGHLQSQGLTELLCAATVHLCI